MIDFNLIDFKSFQLQMNLLQKQLCEGVIVIISLINLLLLLFFSHEFTTSNRKKKSINIYFRV